jgi:hypothetical protein
MNETKSNIKNYLPKKIENGIIRESVMLITLINRTYIFLFILLSALNVFADSFPNDPLKLCLNNGSNVTVTQNGKKINARYYKNGSDSYYKVNANLTSHFEKAEEVFFIFKVQSKKDLFVILTREPSRQNRTTSFCGAGYEDYLILIEVAKNRVSLLDTVLLQSCLKSILLRTDRDDDPLQAITIKKDNSSITFQWFGENEDKKRMINIDNSHFVLQ